MICKVCHVMDSVLKDISDEFQLRCESAINIIGGELMVMGSCGNSQQIHEEMSWKMAVFEELSVL